MTYLTHGLACIAGLWGGILFTLWAVEIKMDTISKILNHSPDDKK